MKPYSLPALVLSLAIAACGEAPLPATEAPLVKTVKATASAGGTERSYSGEVRARHEVPVSFRVGGKLVERRVEAGMRVAAGQVLARLDPADLALQAAQAESQLSLARSEAQRYRDLRQRNYVSAAALDAKENALKAAESQAGIARNQSAYATLTAESAGVVAAVLAEPGQVVAAGQPVLRVARDGEREVAIALPESVVGDVKVGDKAMVELWAAGTTLEGRARELAPVADPVTRTFAARVTLLAAPADIALGQTARVSFAQSESAAMIVPMSALIQQGDRPAVWVVADDSTLNLRPIAVGRYTDTGAVVTGGLKPGERIVAAGVHKLTAGQKVRVTE